MNTQTTEESAPALGAQVLLPKRRDLASRSAGLEALVRDPSQDSVHFLNPTAIVIWECCDGATSVASCAAHLRMKFNIPPEVDLIADINETIVEFNQRSLLENGHASL